MKLACLLVLVSALCVPLGGVGQQTEKPLPSILTAESLRHAELAGGKLSEVRTLTSRVYDGMVTEYRVYVPAQYDPAKPAALMVFQDGLGYAHRDGATRR